jgi:hypothetical protein
MDPRFQSSFIPKKPIAGNVKPARGPINVLWLISIVVFVVALAGCVAVYFYQSYLNSSIASDEQSLNLTQGQFDPSTINQIIRLDSRLTNAKSLLSSHQALSNLFAALENTTLQSVRFSNFTFGVGDQNALTVTMSGEAKSFSDIALQSQVFNKTTYFKNLVISGLTVEPTGYVAFNAAMTIDPSLLSYIPPTSTTTVQASTNLEGTTTATSTNTSQP